MKIHLEHKEANDKCHGKNVGFVNSGFVKTCDELINIIGWELQWRPMLFWKGKVNVLDCWSLLDSRTSFTLAIKLDLNFLTCVRFMSYSKCSNWR